MMLLLLLLLLGSLVRAFVFGTVGVSWLGELLKAELIRREYLVDNLLLLFLLSRTHSVIGLQ